MRKFAGITIPENATEIEELRESHRKVFDLGNGKKQLIVTRRIEHYKDNPSDPGEKWKEIKLEAVKRGNIYLCETAPYKVEISSEKPAITYTSKQKGTVFIELTGNFAATAQPEGDKVWWRDVAPGLDIYLQLKNQGVEFFKVYKDASAPKELVWRYVIDKDVMFGVPPLTSGGDALKRRVNVETKIEEKDLGDQLEILRTETFIEQHTEFKGLKTRIRQWVDGVVYPVLIDVEVTENITTDADDDGSDADFYGGRWYGNGGYANNWEVGFNSLYTSYYNAGLRFQTVAIPNAATIDSAVLTIEVTYVYSSPLTHKVYGDDVDTASAFSNSSLPRNITKTTASTDFVQGTTGVKNIDVKTIVQEIVDRAGWASGNNLRFGILEGTTSGAGHRAFKAADTGHATGAPAVLVVNYTEGGATAVKDIIQHGFIPGAR